MTALGIQPAFETLVGLIRYHVSKSKGRWRPGLVEKAATERDPAAHLCLQPKHRQLAAVIRPGQFEIWRKW